MLRLFIMQLVCKDGFCEDPMKKKLALSSACGRARCWSCMQIPVRYLVMFCLG